MRGVQRYRTLLQQCMQTAGDAGLLQGSTSTAAAAASVGAAAQQVAAATDFQRVTTRLYSVLTRQLGRPPLGVHQQDLQQAQRLLMRSLRRPFCSEPPRKGFEKFYPKGKGRRSTENAKNKPDGKARAAGTGEQTLGDALQNKGLQQMLLLASVVSLAAALVSMGRSDVQEVSFQWFKTHLLAKGLVDKIEVSNKNTAKVYVRTGAMRGSGSGAGMSEGNLDGGLAPGQMALPGPRSVHRYYFNIGSIDSFERKLEEAEAAMGMDPDEHVPVTYTSELSWQQELLRLAPTILLIAGYVYFTRRQMGSLGGGMGQGGRGLFNVGKAQVTTLDKTAKNKIMFKDVAGCDEAKAEVMEFVNFLKAPTKYKDLGAKIPRGALLVGPPGTGKTLLAKATAGEANVPFLSISGSDFMEMFVGVGPARVRDLFAQARASNPSIIFIDEIDAIGRARGRGGFAGGNDERENTLNQLLVEMDGFAANSGVVVLAGTNRPDILDRALLRPGRFDRQISIDRPDVNGREAIFRVHLGKVKLEKAIEYYSERLAALTPGFAGADIANVVNEAALIAARSDKDAVGMVDFEAAVDRVIGGLEKKNKVISGVERRTVAYHEAGHAVVGWFLEHAEPLLKVSIVPRGTAALGFAQYLPNEDLLKTREQLLDMTCMALGGRAAEELMIGRISTGAQNDLERITKQSYAQVAVYGMNEKVGLVSFPPEEGALNKPYSEATGQLIDNEVRALIDTAYARTLGILREKAELVEALAQGLMEKEVLNLEELEELLGKRPYSSLHLRNIDRFRDGNPSVANVVSGEDAAAAPAIEAEGGSNNGVDGTASEAQEEASPEEASPEKAAEEEGGGVQRKVPPGKIVAT